MSHCLRILSFVSAEVFPSHTHQCITSSTVREVTWPMIIKAIKLSLYRDCNPKFQLLNFLETVVKVVDMLI